MRRFVINNNDEGLRLDKFVQKTVWGMPPSLVYKYIRLKRIKVNGKRAEFSYRLQKGDTVDMYIPDDFSRPEVDVDEYMSAVINLSVAYEDDNILICDKPVGILSHIGDEGEFGSGNYSERETFLFRIKAYLIQKKEYDPSAENSFVPALCNRIDRNTGGLVIAAKNANALRCMNEELRDRGVEKRYLCAVHGRPSKGHDTLSAYIKKDSASKTAAVSERMSEGSKSISTEYYVKAYNVELDLSLLEVLLHTGRTHQIRAHLAFEGFPLLGDGKYGNNKADRAAGWKHQALYSYSLKFFPTTPFFKYLDGVTVTADKRNIAFLKLFE